MQRDHVDRPLSVLTERAATLEELTDSDREVLAFLVMVMRRYGVPGTGATARFVAEQTGLTRYAVKHALRRLAASGILDIEPGRGPLPIVVHIPGTWTP